MTEKERHITLIFALQTAWPFVHGSKDIGLLKDLAKCLRHGEEFIAAPITAEDNNQMVSVLERCWKHVDRPFTSNSAKNEVRGALATCATIVT